MKKTRTLHIGVNPLNLRAAIARVSPRWTIDGDGWESWGEAVGTDINDDHTLHLTMPGLTRKQAKQIVLEVLDLLMPVGKGRGQVAPGAVAFLTNGDDWAEEVIDIYPASTVVMIDKHYAALGSRVVCEGCKQPVMLTMACPNAKDECLNCCGEDH